MTVAEKHGGRPRVGFVGLGRMGTPMARNVLAAGFPLTVFNRSAQRCEPLRAAGASVAATPAQLAARSDVVVTMVSDAAAAEAVIRGADGVLERAGEGLTIVEMSTIGPDAARGLAASAAQYGVALIDAPVSGSVSVAEAAQLTAMVGGEQGAFERVRPVLAAMTKAQTHLGPSGSGAAMKLALNIVIASTTHAVSEALVLAEGAGIVRDKAYEVIATSAVASPFVAYKRAAFLDPDGVPTAFALELMRKDLALALALGGSEGVPLLAASAAAEAIAIASGLEGAGEDLVRLADALRRIARGRDA